jgi:hypothetical protein
MIGRLAIFGGAAALVACATGDWARMQAEFPEVRANCRLHGTTLERNRRDPQLLHLIFRQRNAEELQARADGRLACAEHWAEENGFRLTTEPDHGGAD